MKCTSDVVTMATNHSGMMAPVVTIIIQSTLMSEEHKVVNFDSAKYY